MDIFTGYMQPILVKEGGYSDDPNDRGGPTKYGVTEARARAAGYTGDMRDLTLEQAMSIYRLFYWVQPQFDRLAVISGRLGFLALDLGINQGTAWPGHYLQRALNVLNRQATDFPDVKVDGVFGALSRAALVAFLRRRGAEGEKIVTEMLLAQAAVHYIEIAETTPNDETFEFGWQDNRILANTNLDLKGLTA